MSVCLSVVKHFPNRYFYNFSHIFSNFGTRDLRANMQKSAEQIFEILIILANVLNFKSGLSLRNSSSGAVWASTSLFCLPCSLYKL